MGSDGCIMLQHTLAGDSARLQAHTYCRQTLGKEQPLPTAQAQCAVQRQQACRSVNVLLLGMRDEVIRSS